MKLITITAAALGALALAACTPAENEAAEDATATGAGTSTTPAYPDDMTTPPGQTPPTLPPQPNGSTSPATSSPPPM